MNWWLFFLAFARIFALMQTAPLLSSRSVPLLVRIAMSLFTAYGVTPALTGIVIPQDPVSYYLLLAGEAMLGAAMGLFMQMAYMVFLSAGRFMGLCFGNFSGDADSPVAGLMNYAAVFVFLAASGLYSLFFIGVTSSFKALSAYDIAACREGMALLLTRGFSAMFAKALLTALPVIAVPLLVTLITGILRHMDFGWSAAMVTGIIMLAFVLPFLMDSFGSFIDSSFDIVSGWISSGGSL